MSDFTQKQRDAQYRLAKEAQIIFRDCITSAMAGQLDKLEDTMSGFLKANADATAVDMIIGFQSEGRTLLHVAASSGHAHIVDYLLSKLPAATQATAINTPDDRGFTPLLNAVISENDTVLTKLISLGGDVRMVNKDKAGCCHFAAGDGCVPRLRLLAAAGADCTLPSLTGGTPLHWAAGKARSEAIKYLLSLRPAVPIDIDSTAGTGVPAVVMAASTSCDAGTAALVQAGADTGAILSGNLTVLHICAEHNLLTAAAAMLVTPTGLRCALQDTDDGNRPVHMAAMVGHREMVELLLPASGDVGSGGVDALLADGVGRLAKWESAHGNAQGKATDADNGHPSSTSTSVSIAAAAAVVPRSTRTLEPITAASSPEAAMQAGAVKGTRPPAITYTYAIYIMYK